MGMRCAGARYGASSVSHANTYIWYTCTLQFCRHTYIHMHFIRPGIDETRSLRRWNEARKEARKKVQKPAKKEVGLQRL